MIKRYKHSLLLGLAALIVFGGSYFVTLPQVAKACTNAGDVVIGLNIIPAVAEEETTPIEYSYSISAKNCTKGAAAEAELSKLQWYVIIDSGSVQTHYLEMSAPGNKWTYDTKSKVYYIVKSVTYPFNHFKVGGRIIMHPEIVSSDNPSVVLHKGETATVEKAGTPPINNAPANNGCTGEGCGNVSNSDFDKNVGSLNNPINIDTFPELIVFVLRGFFFLIGLMALLVIVIGGVRLVFSQGNQESITKGKQTIIWAIAGLIVALMAYSLVSVVQNLLSK
jgi:hypothetical protein